MIVIHGVDRFGRVEGVEGEYLITRFHHLFLMPLVPLGSEWVMRQQDGELMGRPCRLSGKSVLAAYLRTWGVLVAGVGGVIAASVSPIMIVPAVIIGAGALASWRWRRMRDPRALRRVALQRAVFGSALDPARLKRPAAAEMVRAAEERFAEVSAGRTALDLARTGSVSAEQRARAFVVLRLAAACARGGGKDALAASNRILDRRQAHEASDGPFRTPPPPVATEAPPLLQAASLRPHRWHWLIATLMGWASCAVVIPQLLTRSCESKTDIAHAGVRVLAFESAPRWRHEHPGARCPTLEELVSYAGSVKDPWRRPYQVRCGTGGVVVWSSGENQRDDGGRGDDIVSWK